MLFIPSHFTTSLTFISIACSMSLCACDLACGCVALFSAQKIQKGNMSSAYTTPLLVGRYEHVAAVGKGGFGIVEEFLDLLTGEHVAIKTIPSRFVNQESKRLIREIDTMSFLHDAHPHVIGYFSMFATPLVSDDVLSREKNSTSCAEVSVDSPCFDVTGPHYANLSYAQMLLKHYTGLLSVVDNLRGSDEFNLHIVMPLMKGDLLYFIKHASPSSGRLGLTDGFIEQVTVVFAFQICFGLDFLHKCNIVHRDMKPENILVRLHSTNPYESTALIADLGLARDVQTSDTFYVCTRYYRPPEIVTNVSRGETSIDVWSLGCVFFEMVTGKALFAVSSALNERGVWDGHLASTQLEVILNTIGTPSHEDINRFMPRGTAQLYLLRSAPRPSRLVDIMRSQWRLRTTKDRQKKWIDLISSCLAFFPEQRPTCEDLCRHELFQEYNVFYGDNVRQYAATKYQPTELGTLNSENKQIILRLVRSALHKSSPDVDTSIFDGTEWNVEESSSHSPDEGPQESFEPVLGQTPVDGPLVCPALGSKSEVLKEVSEDSASPESTTFPLLSDPELQEQYAMWGSAGETREEAVAKILGDLQYYTHDPGRSKQLRILLNYFSSLR
uniref:Protein kinase domain-containing protein n=1 Tax=Trypanosoma congolense (strain IL3000) TaxID=1068625 RepID=G0UXM2_TRYCI|nr:putative protein kinase [Trypanosoma congolense IL3000]